MNSAIWRTGLFISVFLGLVGAMVTGTHAQDQIELTGTHYFSQNDSQTNTLHIFSYDFQSGNVSQITSGPHNNTSPSSSTGGRWVAFTSDRDGDNEIFIIDTETGIETQLTVNEDFDDFPSISPDGTQITYLSRRPAEFTDVWIIRSDGTQNNLLVDGNRTYLSSSWSYDGDSLAVVGLGDTNNEMLIIDLATLIVEQTFQLPSNFVSPSWSPDGTKIALNSFQGSIGVLELDTGVLNQIQLTAEKDGLYWFDNSTVGYISFDRIYTVNINTEEVQFYPVTLSNRITNLSGVESVNFFSDSSELQLASLCSPDPNTLRVWRVHNSNPNSVNFTWNVVGTQQTGSGTVPGGSEENPGEITFETTAVATSDTVTISVDGTVQDTVSSDSAGVSDTASLITAITDANNSVDINTVCLSDGTYTLTSSQVTDYGTNGLPLITSDITLVGLGDNVVIEREAGAPAFRLFHVKDTGALTLENITLSNGDAGTGHGGAIYARGPVTLRDVTLTDNFARRGGAVRVNGAPLTVTGSTFQGNTSDREGGAIYISGTDVNVDLSASQFISNSTQNSGGAVYLSGTATTFTADDVFFQSNQANSGGAIFAVPATLDITNSTFDSNSASQNDGGAIYTSSSSMITVTNSTFTLNGASDDGGALRAGGNLTLTGSTFTSNFSAVGAGVFSQNAATITGNRIEANAASELGGGLFVSHNGNPHSITGNCISGNSAVEFSGLSANTSTTDATGNYWGAADGPGGSGPGTGDTVNSRVDFAGFLATCPLD